MSVEAPWKKNVKVNTYGFKGTLYPFQHQGALFLSMVKCCLLNDSVGLGKTLEAIAAYEILRNKHEGLQIIVCTLASAQIQWLEEGFKEFLPGARIEVVPASPSPASSRELVYQRFARKEIDGMIVNYDQFRLDSTFTEKIIKSDGTTVEKMVHAGPLLDATDFSKFILVLDEVQRCKNISAKTSRAIQFVSKRAQGIKALTATPVYTHLVDIYGIFKILDSQVFKTKERFKHEFCKLDYTFSPYGRISGYKNHEQLKERIKGFVFGRSKREVLDQLPEFFSKTVYVDLPKFHQDIYDRLKDREDFSGEEEKIEKIASIVHMQVCSNNLECVKDLPEYRESHPKIDEALRLVTEDLVGQKIIIFSQFLETINILEQHFKNIVDIFRISGVESQIERNKNKKAWQESKNTAVLLMTTAGGVALNLQAAETIIMIDRPWSTGSQDQIRGRLDRIGSKHESILEINIIARGTIDEYILDSLKKKRRNIKKVFGKSDLPRKIKEMG